MLSQQAPNLGGFANASPIEFEKYEAAASNPETDNSILQAGALTLNRWHHLAVVFDRSATRVYLDGALVGTTPYSGGIGSVSAGGRRLIGSCSLFPNNSFHGELSEVRWGVARTAEQIRQNKDKELSGTESGLVGLWNFGDPANPGRDTSPNHYDATLVGRPRTAAPELTKANAAPSAPRKWVLDVDGTDSYVELPSDLFTNGVVTVEGWVKWRKLAAYSRMFDFYGQQLQFGVQNRDLSGTLHAERMERDVAGAVKGFSYLQASGVLTSNLWYHIAVVAGANGTKLYINGALVVTNESFDNWKPPREPDRANYLGRSALASQREVGADPDLDGQISEVRLWAGERSAVEIQTNLLNHLTGKEAGLIALWNFDDPSNPGRDATPNGYDGKLKGHAKVIEEWPVTSSANPVSNSQVLDLSGTNSYVELPARLYTNTLVTIEGWVKWRSFGIYSRWFQFADAGLMLAVMNLSQSNTLRIERYDNAQFDGLRVAILTNALHAGEWQHLALVAGTEPDHVNLYLNGNLIPLRLTPENWKPNPLPRPGNYLGRSVMKGASNAASDTDLDGQMDEVVNRFRNIECSACHFRNRVPTQNARNYRFATPSPSLTPAHAAVLIKTALIGVAQHKWHYGSRISRFWAQALNRDV